MAAPCPSPLPLPLPLRSFGAVVQRPVALLLCAALLQTILRRAHLWCALLAAAALRPGRVMRAVAAPGRLAPLGLALPGLVLLSALLLGLAPAAAWASPGICVGPVCGDGFSRSAKHSFQLRMRLSDQAGHHERITVDCRDGRISPAIGPVERGYGGAVARRVCRLVG